MREPLRPAVIAPWRPAALALLAALAGCGRDPLDCGGEAMPLAEARRLAAGGEARGPVTVEGVVAADFAGGLGGFFLAAPEGEPEAALFVAAAIPGLAPGTRLRLSAEPARLPPEMHGRPALVRVSGHRACGTARPPVTELKAPPEDWETLEGRSVRIASPLLLAGHGELAARGELIVAFGGERPFQPTELFPPGEPAQRFAREQRRRLLVLDDGREAPPAGGLPWFWTEPPARLRLGGRLTGAEGVVDRGAEGFLLRLTAPLALAEAAPRPPPPPRDPAALRVAAFNLENFFNGDGEGGGFPTPRGARDRAAFERQAGKLVATLVALDADLLALAELENDGHGERSAVAELTRRLNEAVPEPARYAFVTPGSERLGGDEIAVGILYRPARLELLGRPAFLDGAPFSRGLSRVPLAASFRERTGGPAFTLVSVHLKSKASCPQAPGPDADAGDGQGCWNAARAAAMRAILDWLAGDPTGAGVGEWLIAGDFNAHAEEEPLAIARERGALDALRAGSGALGLYSYVYRGLAGRLDHIVVSPGLAARLRTGGAWHLNADEPALLGYAGAFAEEASPYRSSDHDPVWVELASAAP